MGNMVLRLISTMAWMVGICTTDSLHVLSFIVLVSMGKNVEIESSDIGVDAASVSPSEMDRTLMCGSADIFVIARHMSS